MHSENPIWDEITQTCSPKGTDNLRFEKSGTSFQDGTKTRNNITKNGLFTDPPAPFRGCHQAAKIRALRRVLSFSPQS